MIRSRGNGRRPACHSIGDGYVQGRTSGKNSDEQSLTSQVDFGWALWKTQKTATFSQKAKIYLLDVCWTGEETCKATASNVTFICSNRMLEKKMQILYDQRSK